MKRHTGQMLLSILDPIRSIMAIENVQQHPMNDPLYHWGKEGYAQFEAILRDSMANQGTTANQMIRYRIRILRLSPFIYNKLF